MPTCSTVMSGPPDLSLTIWPVLKVIGIKGSVFLELPMSPGDVSQNEYDNAASRHWFHIEATGHPDRSLQSALLRRSGLQATINWERESTSDTACLYS
jgi:hypothetical protein